MMSSTSPSSGTVDGDTGDGGSTSTITSETTTGRHELKIEKYTRTKGGVGKCIDSAPFTVGGHCWYIRYYPDGNCDESSDWISLYLYLVDVGETVEDDDGDVKARYNFSLIRDGGAAGDGDGEPPLPQQVESHTRSSQFSLWNVDHDRRGFSQFIKCAELEEATKGGGFRIRCDITVLKETCVETTTGRPLVTVPAPELNRHLGALLDSGVGADVTFDVGGEDFAAHRYVLAARSSVLMAELFGPMKESAMMTSIKVDDVEPRVFRALLHFIYTDSLPEMEEDDVIGMAQHLLVAADRYGMQRLKLMCEVMLLKHIDASVLATTLTLAEQHGCYGLKKGCFNFLAYPGNTKAVLESDGFQHLRSSCPSLIEEILLTVAP